MTDAAWSSILRAQALLEVGREAEAADVARRVLEDHPDHATALGVLAEALRTSDPPGSYAAAQEALRLAPSDPWIHIVAAWSAETTGRGPEARRLIRSAIDLDPDNPSGHQGAAQILAKDPSTRPAAITSARVAIELAPEDAATWIAAGNASLHAERIDDARMYFEYALQLDPGNRVATRNLAVVRDAGDEVVHAMDLLTGLIRLDPADHDTRDRIDSLYRRLLYELLWVALPVGYLTAAIVQALVER